HRRDIVGEPGQIGEQWKLRIRRAQVKHQFLALRQWKEGLVTVDCRRVHTQAIREVPYDTAMVYQQPLCGDARINRKIVASTVHVIGISDPQVDEGKKFHIGKALRTGSTCTSSMIDWGVASASRNTSILTR